MTEQPHLAGPDEPAQQTGMPAGPADAAPPAKKATPKKAAAAGVDVQIQRRLGAEPVRTDRPQRHAVVIGGSMAGLLAAHVLTVYADKVTLIERDTFPKGPESRVGLPQDHHTHVLIGGGQRALDALLPGVVDDLVAAGAVRVAMPHDVIQWQDGRWYRRPRPSSDIVSATRGLTDHVVRRRVLANRQIERAEGVDAVGLAGSARRVTGVLVRDHNREGQAGEPRRIAADLVVDATGRGTRAPEWLGALGAEAPNAESVDTGLAYASRLFKVPGGRYPEDLSGQPGSDYRGIYMIPGRGMTRGGVLMPLEDGRAIVTLSGLRGDEPPTDEDGFAEFAAGLAHPLLRDWIDRAEPDGPVRGYRKTANIRRRYDRPGRRPAGFLAIGDAICTFNPIYGQGMAVAAMSAVAMRDALAGLVKTATTARVQKAIFDASAQAWSISAGADRRMPGAVGGLALPIERPVTWYVDRLQRRAAGDPEVGAVFRSVLHLMEPQSAFFAPAVARAVLLGPEPEVPAGPPLEPEDGPRAA